ncbi:hypothetical protein CROQUDRAFT_99478 [Cronartium quercuum f. sp. fusiforme G11]|uniref:Uncharacterized protein n=1 Tax=Cronartium quercuum f. sp. fusiforme G11 TaxID=708437 RepID=A0A9P6T6D6_9BASI|nr:hypothetical protein CROQUDRAFT_99478 [Cronartium quercuum f. sp. fusiforme G11]
MIKQLPDEIIRLICLQIEMESKSYHPKLLIDPYIQSSNLNPFIQSQITLKTLALVSKAWYTEARKSLWSIGVKFGLPNSFEKVVKLVDPIGTFFDGTIEPSWITESSPTASRYSSPLRTGSPKSILTSQSPFEFKKNRRSISLKRESGNYVIESRLIDYDENQDNEEVGRGRLNKVNDHHHLNQVERSISPIRDEIWIQSLSKAFQSTSPTNSTSSTEEFIFDHQIDDILNPGPYITSLSFSKFRSHGMRRSIGESQQIRFVTDERLLRLLKSTRSRYENAEIIRKGNLKSVGFSEYMDSAISKEVLDEMFLRGGVEVQHEIKDDDDDDENRGRDRGRKELFINSSPISRHATHHHTLPAIVKDKSQGYNPILTSDSLFTNKFQGLKLYPQMNENKITRYEKRLESNLINETPIEAIDFCGCISSKFIKAIKEFILDHSLNHLIIRNKGIQFPWLNRLGLSHVNLLNDLELSSFLSGFPNLTHLDLSHTKSGTKVLKTLKALKKTKGSSLNKYKSLNLSKCKGFNEINLIDFFVDDNIDQEGEESKDFLNELEELSLFGDINFFTPILIQDIPKLIKSFNSNHNTLITLDLSSIKLNDILLKSFPNLPNLIQLGLSNIHDISLKSIKSLILNQLKNLEILDLTNSCSSNRIFRNYKSVLSSGTLHTELINPSTNIENGKRLSKLRVIELDCNTLINLSGGINNWKVNYGNGNRGWYVDLSITIKIEETQNNFERVYKIDHQSQNNLNQFISSDQVIRHNEIGWMSHKLEILDGTGFLGRQDGLYAFHAFAHNST